VAEFDTTPFPVLLNISDDSPFVHQAMRQLGYSCDFADLTTEEMQVILALAEYFKRSAAEADEWES
jgi:hypothetical protein